MSDSQVEKNIKSQQYDVTLQLDDTGKHVTVKFLVNGKFKRSVAIPSKMHPLPEKDYKIFTASNTEPIKDRKILDAIDTIKFTAGMCYTSAEAVYKALKDIGYNPEVYEGWFIHANPICRIAHHCVCVLDNHVIDMTLYKAIVDHYISLYNKNNEPDARKVMVSVIETFDKMKNSEANPLIGQVYEEAIYIGAKSTPEEAITHFNNLMDLIPNHPDYSGNGMTRYGNKLNEMLMKKGYYK